MGNKKIDKENIENILALTPTQEGMLFHYIKNKEKNEYIQQLSIQLSGEICVETIQKSWQHVMTTNEMLRTIFRWTKLKHSVQVVLKNVEVPIKIVDYSNRSVKDQEELVQELKEQDKQIGVDIETSPFRVTVCLLTENCCEMIITWHHILFDGWSNSILLNEFLDGYKAFYVDDQPLQRNKTKFKEFISWHKTQDKHKQKLFWESNFIDFEPSISLPYDVEHVQGSSLNDIVITSLTTVETEEIHHFTRQNDITLASLFYSVWGILLQKYNQTSDVVFGTTVSGRTNFTKAVEEEMVGLFIHTIPLRIQSKYTDTVKDVIHSVDRSLQLRSEFENTPLVDIEQYADEQPLFQSIVVLENYPLDVSNQIDSLLKIDGYDMVETTNFELTLGLKTFNDLFEIEFSYDTSKFSKQMIQRMGGHFTFILKQIIHYQELKLSELELVTTIEKEQIFNSFNPLIVKNKKIDLVHLMFEKQVEKSPNQIAVVSDGLQYTYKEMNEKANQLARYLRKRGISSNDRVAITIERSAYLLISTLGILKAGATYIPIDENYSSERISYILNDSQAEVWITQSGIEKKINFDGLVIHINDEDIYKGEALNLQNTYHFENIAYIIYTSGSTGNPKGVKVTHANLSNYVEAFQREFNLTRNDVILQQSSFSFDQFAEEVYPILLNGGSIVMADRLDVMDMRTLLQLIHDHHISIISCSPLLLNELNKQQGLEKVHTFISGGDILKYEFFSNLVKHSKIYNTYGPTEATVCATYYQCGLDSLKNIPIGRPIHNYNVYILDELNHLMPIGVYGEICITGHGVASGYVNHEQLSNEKFISDPFQSHLRMYKTGDMGKWLPDGNIQYLGRNDDQVKIRGFRIELGEIEFNLRSHNAVEEAFILAVDDVDGQKQIAAYVKLIEEVDSIEFRDFLSDKLPHYMIPTSFYKIDTIPKTSNGKLDKKRLIQCKDRLNEEILDDESFISESEQKIKQVWMEVLEVEKVGIHDQFFDVGGNSILLMQLHSQLEKRFNWGTNIVDLFNHPTIAKLAKFIDHNQQKIDLMGKLSYQKLPSQYFHMNMQASGMNKVRYHIDSDFVKSIRSIASDHQVNLLDVLLAMYLYLFTEVSGEKAAQVQYLKEYGEEVIPLKIEIHKLGGFAQLFQVVNELRRGDGYHETYTLNSIHYLTLKKEKNFILPFIYNNTDVSIDAKFLEFFDITCCVEEDEKADSLTVTFKFNDRKIKKDMMSFLIKAYVNLLKQLVKNTNSSRKEHLT
ncbi:non-ribosomal peptide synthetase [Chengkuizengella sediminis]|uniref:non-ribosomal peptide synthetase n=1 Tax=Chengkuizengella sediminis TaxID=1885917 RepID=UPI0013895B45|nr:non-ribosomal peptide synthetase [Chengkuizengella sediminis]NDI34210.1 amino acid adenylation domain-containing protein [Chengkuizengella sediminis]